MSSMCLFYYSYVWLLDDPAEECCPEASEQPQAELCCFHYAVIHPPSSFLIPHAQLNPVLLYLVF